MNETLFNTFEAWLQGQINTCISGVMSRLSRLEELNVDDQITGLRMENDKLRRWLDALNARLTELEDRRVENAPDEQLEGFADRVRDIVADYVDNDDQLMTRHVFDEMVEAFINESVFKIKVR